MIAIIMKRVKHEELRKFVFPLRRNVQTTVTRLKLAVNVPGLQFPQLSVFSLVLLMILHVKQYVSALLVAQAVVVP
jgi:hypothetical protein